MCAPLVTSNIKISIKIKPTILLNDIEKICVKQAIKIGQQNNFRTIKLKKEEKEFSYIIFKTNCTNNISKEETHVNVTKLRNINDIKDSITTL